MSNRPNVDTNPVAAARERREALIAPPLLCRFEIVRQVQAAADAGETLYREDLADVFGVDPRNIPFRILLQECADEGLIRLVPDVPGCDDFRVHPPAQSKTRRKAA